MEQESEVVFKVLTECYLGQGYRVGIGFRVVTKYIRVVVQVTKWGLNYLDTDYI